MPKAHKVLITGSSGMLGADLAAELSNDYDVWGTDLVDSPPERRSRAGSQFTVDSFCKSDITDRDDIAAVIEKIRPDVVVHTAAWTDVDGCELDKNKAYRVNADGTRNVALACKDSGSTLVYISTDFVFSGKKKTPYKESDRTSPLSVYGDSKLRGEEAVSKALKQYFILRTSWLYGANGKNFVDTIIAKARNGDSLKVVDDQIGSPTYTVDLAEAIHALLNKIVTRSQGHKVTGYGVYHMSNAGSVTWYEYAKEILRLSGIKTPVVPISSEKLTRPARRPAMSVLDNSKFGRFAGYRMRHWKKALESYLIKR